MLLLGTEKPGSRKLGTQRLGPEEGPGFSGAEGSDAISTDPPPLQTQSRWCARGLWVLSDSPLQTLSQHPPRKENRNSLENCSK